MYSFSYDIVKENTINVRYGSDISLEDKTIVINMYVNDKKYYTDEMIVNGITDISIPYYANDTKPIDFKIEVIEEDRVVSDILKVYPKDGQIYESNKDDIFIKAVSVSMKNLDFDQVDYYETFNAKLNNHKLTYYAGEGINTNISYDYHNECGVINEYKCEVINKNDIDFKAKATFDNGALPIRNDYVDGNKYSVQMSEIDKILMYPNVYVDKITGEVFRNNNSNLLDGRNRWYTDRKLKLKDYNYQIISDKIGYNEFRFKYNIDYTIDRKIDDLYKVRFADNNKPFGDDYNGIWENSLKWFDSLDSNNSLYEFEYKK